MPPARGTLSALHFLRAIFAIDGDHFDTVAQLPFRRRALDEVFDYRIPVKISVWSDFRFTGARGVLGFRRASWVFESSRHCSV
jgi:hypothetical protein